MVNMGDDVRVCLLEVKVGPFLYTHKQCYEGGCIRHS